MKRAATLYVDSQISSVWMLRIKDGADTLMVQTSIPYCDAIKAGDIDELCHVYNCELMLERAIDFCNPAQVVETALATTEIDAGAFIRSEGTAPDTVAMVREFHEAFEYEIPEKPCVLGVRSTGTQHMLQFQAQRLQCVADECKRYLALLHNKPSCIQRVALIAEEFSELCDAMANENMVFCLDACEDLEYVLMGTLVSLGLAPVHHEAFRRVHASNMSKRRNGVVVKDENGKVVKGDWYSPVDLSDLVV